MLSQYLVRCPQCGKPAAAHLDESHPGACVLVRLVCPDACMVDERSVLSCIPASPHPTKEYS